MTNQNDANRARRVRLKLSFHGSYPFFQVHLVLDKPPKTRASGTGGAVCVLALLMLALCGSELSSENVTLTTYYPAPSGVYTEMITTRNTYLARDGGNVGVGTITPSHKLEVNGDASISGDASVRTLLLTSVTNVGTACSVQGQMASAPDGRLLSCQGGTYQPQMQVSEELGSILGCYSPNAWCRNATNLPSGATPDPLFNSYYGNGWDAVIGPRTFCALGFVSFTSPGSDPDPSPVGGYNMCRVLPGGTDPATGKLIWHIRVGSGGTSIACHAVCIL